MKETIYTIPINEAFEACGDHCPVCALHKKLTRETIEYTLGAAMMEPDARERTNKRGFCTRHLKLLMGEQKRLPLALVLETHIAAILEDKADENTCAVCDRVDGFMAACVRNILFLWDTSPEFRALWQKTPYLCLPHVRKLYNAAQTELKRKPRAAFQAELQAKSASVLRGLHNELTTFTKSFDHRFADVPLGDAAQAIEHTAAFLSIDD